MTKRTTLYLKHRPKTLDEVVGQADAVRVLRQKVEDGLPPAVMLYGPPGTGKTTLARIIARRSLKCHRMDFEQVNCARIESPIDAMRGIGERCKMAPTGDCRVWVLEEFQSLSRAAFAQQALLDVLEDAPDDVYFFLTTTDPAKIIKAIQSRCLKVKLNPLSSRDIENGVLAPVLKKENKAITLEVLQKIAEVADGSAREALVLLDAIIGLENEKDQLEAVQRSDSKRQAIELARALLNPKSGWKEVAGIIRELDGEEPERLRRMVLGYSEKVVLGGGPMADRAYFLLTVFESDWFASGRSGLVRACREVFKHKE